MTMFVFLASEVGFVVAAPALVAAELAAAAAGTVVLTPVGALFASKAALVGWRGFLAPGRTVVEEGPIFLAWEEEASLAALSRMACCFSSPLARMGTRSSGIGLLSYTQG